MQPPYLALGEKGSLSPAAGYLYIDPAMPIAGASAVRVFGFAVSLAMLTAPIGCGDAGPKDGAPDVVGGAGAGAASGSGGAGDGLVPWCDAYQVINCSCQQCHQDPTRNGAAMPLMTYEDTQRPFPQASSPKKVWQQMQQAVMNGSMPLTGDESILPPVKALTSAQRSTLLAWLAQGARDEGGLQCVASCIWR